MNRVSPLNLLLRLISCQPSYRIWYRRSSVMPVVSVNLQTLQLQLNNDFATGFYVTLNKLCKFYYSFYYNACWLFTFIIALKSKIHTGL